jgi:hypothetical protein
MLRDKFSDLGLSVTVTGGADPARAGKGSRKSCASDTRGSKQERSAGDHLKALEDVKQSSRWNDPSLYVLGFVVGLVPIIAVLIRGGSWGAEPTIGLVFCVIFGAALVQHALDRTLRRHSDCTPHPTEPPASADKHTWSHT